MYIDPLSFNLYSLDLAGNPEFVVKRCQLIFEFYFVFPHMDAPGHPPHAQGVLSQLN